MSFVAEFLNVWLKPEKKILHKNLMVTTAAG